MKILLSLFVEEFVTSCVNAQKFKEAAVSALHNNYPGLKNYQWEVPDI